MYILQIIYPTQAPLDFKQWNYTIIYILQILKTNYYRKKKKTFYKKDVDAEKKLMEITLIHKNKSDN